MSEDKSKRGPVDWGRIEMHEQCEVDFWTRKFGVTRDKLQQAVTAVGASASQVESWLKRNGQRHTERSQATKSRFT